jgi:hypothetical protein
MARHRRGRSPTSAVPPPVAEAVVDPLPLSLPDVYLLTSDSDGQQAVNGLTVVIDHDGLTVLAPHGATAAVLAWSALTILRVAGRTTAPGGEDALLLQASTATRSHRFIVPTTDTAGLEATIAEITGVPPTETSPRRRRRR